MLHLRSRPCFLTLLRLWTLHLLWAVPFRGQSGLRTRLRPVLLHRSRSGLCRTVRLHSLVSAVVYRSRDWTGRDCIAMEIIHRSCWPCQSSGHRRSMVLFIEVPGHLARHLHVRLLHLCRTNVVLAFSNKFLLRRTRLDAALSAVVAYASDIHVVDDGLVHIHVLNHGCVYAVDGRVVEERATAPVSAFIARSEVSIAIVNATIETDVRSPIAGVPYIKPCVPAPVTRCPQITRLRREHPSPRDPVVVISVPCPIAGHPDVIWAGADRLLIYRQRGRAYAHRDSDADLCEDGSRHTQRHRHY